MVRPSDPLYIVAHCVFGWWLVDGAQTNDEMTTTDAAIGCDNVVVRFDLMRGTVDALRFEFD